MFNILLVCVAISGFYIIVCWIYDIIALVAFEVFVNSFNTDAYVSLIRCNDDRSAL